MIQAKTIIDEFVLDEAAFHKTRIRFEFARRDVRLVEESKVRFGERQGEIVDFFAQRVVRVPTFGIRHILRADVRDGRFDAVAFACKRDFRHSAEGEREPGKGARPINAESRNAFVTVAFEAEKFPFLVLQKTVEGMRCPAHVVDELVIVAVPVELGVCHASWERSESAAGVRVRPDFEDIVAFAVAEKEVGKFAGFAVRNTPGVEASAISA